MANVDRLVQRRFCGADFLYLIASLTQDRDILRAVAAACVRVLAIVCIVRQLSDCPKALRIFWYLLLARTAWSLVFVPIRNAYIDDIFWWTLDSIVGTIIYIAAASVLV